MHWDHYLILEVTQVKHKMCFQEIKKTPNNTSKNNMQSSLK